MRQLGDISEHKGKAYARAHLLFEAEDAHAQAILQYKGYLALSDAFKCFFLETVEILNTEVRSKIRQPLSEFYGLLVPRLSQSFLTLCGAERVATRGYPYQGYTLLRNLFDNLLLTSAALQKFTDFYSIEGVSPGKSLAPEDATKLRKTTEFAARRRMTGDQSGLSPATITEIRVWDAMFDFETHGARLSATHAMDWMKGQGTLPVLPKFTERGWTLFMNRYTEVTWMLHRLLPTLQPPDIAISPPWDEKWQVLDLSFTETVNALTEQLGKPIGAALVELVRQKFPFGPQTRFPL